MSGDAPPWSPMLPLSAGISLPAHAPVRTAAAVPGTTSGPDANWGWNSDNKTWYFEHMLYMLYCTNDTLKMELPLLMKFTRAHRHGSKNFLYAIDDFGRNTFDLSPGNICLGSAHDNIPTYELMEHWDINALIDINSRAKSSENTPDDITFNKKDHPVCKACHEMCPWGNAHIPGDSQQYKDIYSERTACERINDRVLNDCCLQHLKIRGKDHFSF